MDSLSYKIISHLTEKQYTLGVSNDVWLPVIASIATFICSILYNNYRENSRIDKKLKVKEEYLYWLLDYLSKVLPYQLMETKKFIDILNTQTLHITFAFNGVPQFDPNLLNAVNDQDLFDSILFRKKTTPEEKIKFYTMLQQVFNSLRVTLEALHDNFLDFSKGLNEINKPLNVALANIQKMHDEYMVLVRTNTDESLHAFFQEFDAIFRQWDEKAKIENTITTVFIPLFKLGNQYTQKELIQNAREARSYSEAMIDHLRNFSSYFTDFFQSIEVVQVFINNDAKTFRSIKARHVWFKRWL